MHLARESIEVILKKKKQTSNSLQNIPQPINKHKQSEIFKSN